MSRFVAWVLVFHLTGMVFWIGGLFMALAAAKGAPATAPAGGAGSAGVEIEDLSCRGQRARIAGKALRGFAHPGAALMIITGGLLLYALPGLRMAAWLHAKLMLVAILIGFDLVLTVRVRRLPERELSPAAVGTFHGGISLLFFLILILVLVRPF